MYINITKNAWNQISKVLKISNNKYGFVFSASSGGCNGFNFNLDLLNKQSYLKLNKSKNIPKLSHNNNNVYIDPLSEMYLIGTTIDYVSDDYENGIFESKFIYNVDKSKLTTCGCGVSFSPK